MEVQWLIRMLREWLKVQRLFLCVSECFQCVVSVLFTNWNKLNMTVWFQFLRAVMDRDFQLASRLCHMSTYYPPSISCVSVSEPATGKVGQLCLFSPCYSSHLWARQSWGVRVSPTDPEEAAGGWETPLFIRTQTHIDSLNTLTHFILEQEAEQSDDADDDNSEDTGSDKESSQSSSCSSFSCSSSSPSDDEEEEDEQPHVSLWTCCTYIVDKANAFVCGGS